MQRITSLGWGWGWAMSPLTSGPGSQMKIQNLVVASLLHCPAKQIDNSAPQIWFGYSSSYSNFYWRRLAFRAFQLAASRDACQCSFLSAIDVRRGAQPRVEGSVSLTLFIYVRLSLCEASRAIRRGHFNGQVARFEQFHSPNDVTRQPSRPARLRPNETRRLRRRVPPAVSNRRKLARFLYTSSTDRDAPRCRPLHQTNPPIPRLQVS